MNKEEVIQIAQKYLDENLKVESPSEDRLPIVDERSVYKKRYGWVVWFHSKRCHATGSWRDNYIGLGPLIIENRGEALGVVNEQSSKEEKFQNLTIRPILKLQNDLFIDVFKNYVSKHKNDFYSYSVEKKLLFIENAIQKDIKFRNSLKGMVIGLFTIDEYAEYIQNSSNLNKRMMNMLIERLKSNVQIFEFQDLS